MASDRTPPGKRASLVIVDLAIARSSPAGSCVLAQIEALRTEYDIIAISARLELAVSASLRFTRVRVPAFPLLLRYVSFVWRAKRLLRDLLRKEPHALVQATQGQFAGAAVCYAHFCHAAYLAGSSRGASAGGLRGLARRLAHAFNARCEHAAFRRAARVVVPSRGLARELRAHYPWLDDRLTVIANPVDAKRFALPADFDRAGIRAPLEVPGDAFALCFIALGDFARKGLHLVIDAVADLAQRKLPAIHVLVVGGRRGEIAAARDHAARLHVAKRVHFVGLQEDVRAFLWASDAFILASAYEAFPLVVLQAAAAGLPVAARCATPRALPRATDPTGECSR